MQVAGLAVRAAEEVQDRLRETRDPRLIKPFVRAVSKAIVATESARGAVGRARDLVRVERTRRLQSIEHAMHDASVLLGKTERTLRKLQEQNSLVGAPHDATTHAIEKASALIVSCFALKVCGAV